MELTKEHFESALKELATKKDLHHLATSNELGEMKSEISAIRKTLNTHTNALDQLVKQTKDWNTEMVMVRARLDRHDQWFKKIAEKVDIKLEV